MRKKIEISELKNYDKEFFALGDLAKIFNIKEESLRVALSRWVKNGKILRIRKNVYQLPDKAYDLKKTAWQFYQPCYLSFESVLNECGILSQIPYITTFATTNKSKKMTFGQEEVEFRQIKKDLFFGYKTENGLFLALPEKALADQIYFISRGLANLNFEELDLGSVSIRKFKSFAKFYPKPAQILAKNLESYFGKTAITIK